MTLHLSRDEWERIAADGGGVLFREGEFAQIMEPDGTLLSGMIPPAEFVEAAKPCETCGGEGEVWPESEWHDMPGGKPCDCLGGKRRIAAVVEHLCFHDGYRILRKDVCDCGTDDGHVTVATVVVEWGPDPIVKYGEHATVGSYVVVLVEPGSRNAFRVENHRLPVEQHEFTLPPDVDPQTLVGQWAIGIKTTEP